MKTKPQTDRDVNRAKPRDGYLKFRARWRHVLRIDEMVRAGKAPNCRTLAAELEVSRRTVLRDIDFLRYDLGAPIAYDARLKGYVYTEPNWVMPSVRITEGELLALMVAEQALEAYAGTPWAEKLRQAFERMLTALPDRVEVAPQGMLSRVGFQRLPAAAVDPGILAAILSAIQENRTLRVRYQPIGRETAREYVLDPYVLRRAQGAWYLAARDRRNDQVPLFNLSRVAAVQATEGTFDYEEAGFDPRKYFEGTFGVYESSERHPVVIEFSGFAAQLVQERHWHDSQKTASLPGGRLRFEVTVSHLDDILPWVLGWGREAKAIEPRALVELVEKESAAIAEQYRPRRGKSLRTKRKRK